MEKNGIHYKNKPSAETLKSSLNDKEDIEEEKKKNIFS